MFIRVTISPNGKSRKVYLVEAYRNKEGKQRQRIIKKYGNLGDLLKQDPNALEKLKENARMMVKEASEVILNANLGEEYARDDVNYGYFFLEKIYNELGINDFIKTISKKQKYKYDLDAILKMLVYGRILNPGSKYKTFKNQHKYFDQFQNSLSNIYRSLSVLNEIKDEVQIIMHKSIKEKIGREVSLVLYDLTNYYFEIEKEDELKKVGVSKERKTTPIMQMGLLIDKNKIPIGYKLFPGNTHDSKTAIPMVKYLKEKFDIKKIILTADKGINTSKNFATLVKQGDGYIVSQKIRGSSKEFIAEVLNDEGYIHWSSDFKYKEVYWTKDVKNDDGEITHLKEKLVIYWSENFDQRQKYKREKLNKKIKNFLNSPSSLNASNAYGIKKYIKTKHLDQTTGEIIKINPKNVFNQKKYDRDVALDGYYCIVTSELKKPVKELLASYHELWKIEEYFKVIKSDLEGRPVYVRRNDRIEGHFLTCFIALTILRIIEFQLGYKYSASKIKHSIANANVTPLEKDDYLLKPKNEVIEMLERKCEAYLSKRYLKLEKLRKYKKQIVHYK